MGDSSIVFDKQRLRYGQMGNSGAVGGLAAIGVAYHHAVGPGFRYSQHLACVTRAPDIGTEACPCIQHHRFAGAHRCVVECNDGL